MLFSKYAFFYAEFACIISVNFHRMFSGDFMLTIIIRTVMIYLVATVAVRIMGKRQVSDMQTSELVITLIISEVASLPLENTERPLLNSLVPIMMIVAIELIVSLLMMKSRKIRSLICGHPIVVIRDGSFIDSQLQMLRISREDVYSLLRAKDISDESGVKYGIIEPNGDLSVITQEEQGDMDIESKDLNDELRKLDDKKEEP